MPACTATNRTWRSVASAKANSTAAADDVAPFDDDDDVAGERLRAAVLDAVLHDRARARRVTSQVHPLGPQEQGRQAAKPAGADYQ